MSCSEVTARTRRGPAQGWPMARCIFPIGGLLLVLLACAGVAAAATTDPPADPRPPASCSSTGACSGAAAVLARRAQHLCSGMPIAEALRSVRVESTAAAVIAEDLKRAGFHDALDLRLLAGGAEAQELMSELSVRGISIADRVKLRLLVGDRAHLGQFESAEPSMDCSDVHLPQSSTATTRRGLQQEAAAADEGVSVDTVSDQTTCTYAWDSRSFGARQADCESANDGAVADRHRALSSRRRCRLHFAGPRSAPWNRHSNCIVLHRSSEFSNKLRNKPPPLAVPVAATRERVGLHSSQGRARAAAAGQCTPYRRAGARPRTVSSMMPSLLFFRCHPHVPIAP
eukprot:SAG31_NODE_100_length_25264_cov_38.715359_21_plen_343_part_00